MSQLCPQCPHGRACGRSGWSAQHSAVGCSSASSLQASVRSVQSIPQTSECNNSQEDEKCHKLFTHKRDEKGEGGEEESLRGRDT